MFLPRQREFDNITVLRYDTYVVTDEIYEHMIFEGEPHQIIASLPGMRERSVSSHSHTARSTILVFSSSSVLFRSRPQQQGGG